MFDDFFKVTENDPANGKPIKLFGRDIRQIVCFRVSFICGICSGVAAGLGCFLFTSKARLSYHFFFTGIWVGTLAYWIPCRYQYETSLYVLEAAKAGKLKLPSDSEKKS